MSFKRFNVTGFINYKMNVLKLKIIFTKTNLYEKATRPLRHSFSNNGM